jgi:pilus assembly protein Flp/PilA
MTDLKALFIRLVQDDSGQDLIEYALVAALIALGALVGMKTLANDIGNAFNSVGSTLTSAQTPAAG